VSAAEERIIQARPGGTGTRIVVGIGLIAGACGLLALDHVIGADHASGAVTGFGLLLVGAVIAGLIEYGRLAGACGAPVRMGPMVCVGTALAALPIAAAISPWSAGGHGEALLLSLLALLLLLPELARTPSREGFLGLATSVFGVFYVGYLASYVARLRVAPWLTPAQGEAAVLFAIFIAKGNDMAAYFTGKYLGKRKVIPWISPKKTWAGMVGGVVGSVVTALIFVYASSLGTLLTWRLAVAAGIILGVVSIAGDLVESYLKRSAAVKDAGAYLPSFGGALDVIDSVLIVAPCTYFLFAYVAAGQAS
jgi:phosphatidate cytidylyltransferase